KANSNSGRKGKGYVAQGTGRISNGERRYSDFPFDGQVLYLPRIDRMMKAREISLDPKEKNRDSCNSWEAFLSDTDISDLKTIKRMVERLQRSGETKDGESFFGLGEPGHYLAILVADGDRMGKIISYIEQRPEHRNLSKKLAEFAK